MMKKDRIKTTSTREIKNSFKRFLSLLVMSMLGVGVFVGLKMAAPDMIMSLDKYYDDNNVYDVKIVSTLGLTNDDINEISKLNGVKKVIGSYSKDVLIKNNKNSESVIKVIGITDDLNEIELKKGKKPKDDSEILVEENMLKRENLKIGDKITLLDDETFNNKELTIVGIVKSPLYITTATSSSNRGNTTIGTGEIDYYAYVNKSNFNLDYYTESYIIIDNAKDKTTNSDEYNKLVSDVLKEIDEIKELRQNARYNEIYNKAKEEIDAKEAEGNAKLNDAKKALDATQKELLMTKNTLSFSKAKLDNTLVKLNDYKMQLDLTKKSLDENKLKLNALNKEIEDSNNNINSQLNNYGINIVDVNSFINFSKELIILNATEEINNIDEQLRVFLSDPQNIDIVIASIPIDIPNYQQIITTAYICKQNSDNFFEILGAINGIKEAEEKYNEGLLNYNTALAEYDKGYNSYISYYNEYQNGLSDYNNGLRRYNNGLNLYNYKIKEFYESQNIFNLEIKDAKSKLDDIKKVKWYTYTRLDDSGYSSFIDDGEGVSNLSKIFPTIFFVVAVLISLISMSRMVEDDRMLIGTLKSLGFNNKHIRKKYLLYSGIATISGGILGALLGFFLLSRYIWNIYKILFDVPVFKYDFNPTNTILGLAISVICICGTTLLTIKKVVKEKPSDLMRPKAPENGKRVILEKIPFIWKRINFSNKITIRNLFRYKKRVLMTICGILGCTALMLVGFGIRDSIVNIPDKQYKEVFKFDDMLYLTDNIKDEEIKEILDNEHIKSSLNAKTDVSMTSEGYNINLFVPENINEIKNVLNLRDNDTKKKLSLIPNKVIVSDKLADLENKKVGDKIKLIDSENNEYEFIISGICENYVGHYVFMDKETYEENITSYKTNIIYLKIDDLKNEESLSKMLMKKDYVMSIVSVDSTMSIIDDMLSSLNSVVVILIFLSGALSFVVLYNLSYINISERKREIATLKVLGFTDKEVDNYITKETIILTLIGIALGLISGIFLTYVIIDTVEIEMVRFLRNVEPFSFVLTTFIVMLFTLIVNKIIHYALKKIDMIESLKSVE